MVLVWVYINRESISDLLLTGGPVLLLLGVLLLCLAPKTGIKLIVVAIAIIICGRMLEDVIANTGTISLLLQSLALFGGG